MLTLTVILSNAVPDGNFFQVLIIALIMDLFIFLYLYFIFEKQKKFLNNKYTIIIDKYKAQQEKYEKIVEQSADQQSEKDDEKGLLSYNLKEQQELRNKLEKSMEKQKELEKEIETYKAKLKIYEDSETVPPEQKPKIKPENPMMEGLTPIS